MVLGHVSKCRTMTLDHLHSTYLENLTGEDQLDYLLICQDYLREDDVNGWKMRFAPDTSTETSEPVRQLKRRRMSPDAVVHTDYPPCLNCKHSRDIISDTAAGSVVCTACGLIQQLQQLQQGSANMSYDQLKNGTRKTVHQYSRVVYFRSFVMALQGRTRPNISGQQITDLRATCAGADFIDEWVVDDALKKLKLATKFRRHKYSLAARLNPEYKNVFIPAPIYFKMLTLFRVVECHWQHGMKRKLHGRRVFFSYPYVFYQLCYHMGYMQYTGSHHLLKSEELLNRQHYAYGCIAKVAGFKYSLTVYR